MFKFFFLYSMKHEKGFNFNTIENICCFKYGLPSIVL
jgi:hypothetical protein